MDLAVPSLLGDNLAARLRSTSLALVGVVGAAALAMVGLTLHYGVALVSSGPIHEPPRSDVSSARAVAERAPESRRTRTEAARKGAERGGEAPTPVPRGVESAPAPSLVEGSGGGPTLTAEPSPEGGGGDAKRHPPSPPPTKPSSPPQAPASQPAPAPVDQPVATPSSEPPPPVAEPPAEEPSPVPGNGNAYGKGSGQGPNGEGPPGLAGR
jgi:hypothetical protein